MTDRKPVVGKRGRGRPKKDITASQIEQFQPSSGYVFMTCNQCKQRSSIHTSNPELYTPELRKTWVCLLCTSIQ